MSESPTMATIPGAAEAAGTDQETTPDRPVRARRPRSIRYASWWWTLPAVLIIVTMHYVSVGVGGFFSFTNYKGFGSFKFVGLDNFVKVFTDPVARGAVGNTLLLALGFVILVNLFGFGFALALNRQLKSRHFLRGLLFMPVVLSPLAVSFVWKFIFQYDGPLNGFLAAVGLGDLQKAWLGDPSTAIWTILLVLVWQHIGITMVIYLAGLANVPQELEEAASMDGAPLLKRFQHVTLPLMRGAVVIATTLSLIRGLSVFDQVIALTAGGPFNATETLATQVWRQTFVNSNFGYGSAIALVLTIVIAVLALAQMGLMRSREDHGK
ncbi:sugar ABC transporter permease [Paenarthrobacter sp. TYUT067]|uniref:carbohydrate ABC transporter permease n=1 Tax=Paenarthrobacter sp. TYUT067 TaxID=2926245 RepID=UPI002030D664|nr:sugar ABC transporter permease [Paenarthrobacter sp. TYUT067]MCM0616827.1 sugar ABC transporter permease [Paenarthrobacter sp. TYUT067]